MTSPGHRPPGRGGPQRRGRCRWGVREKPCGADGRSALLCRDSPQGYPRGLLCILQTTALIDVTE